MQCLALCGPTADSLSILNSKAICSVVQALLRLWWDLEWCSGSLWSRTNKDYCRMIDVFDSVWKIYRIFHALPEYSIKKITKFSIPLVQPCLLTKNIVKIVFLTEKMQKQAVWLQFSNLLLVNLVPEGTLPVSSQNYSRQTCLRWTPLCLSQLTIFCPWSPHKSTKYDSAFVFVPSH